MTQESCKVCGAIQPRAKKPIASADPKQKKITALLAKQQKLHTELESVTIELAKLGHLP